MKERDSAQHFDEWADGYDSSVRESAAGFPFDGYERVQDEITLLAATQPHMKILDLGVGTGSLAVRFSALGCEVWGVDFSSKMIARAQMKLPHARLVRADVLHDWPAELCRRFDRIVSAYVLHHFELDTKICLLERLAYQYLTDGGRIVIGDIAFPSVQALNSARKRWEDLWDDGEYYWAADETIAACERVGLGVTFKQISSCGGVFVIEPSRTLQTR